LNYYKAIEFHNVLKEGQLTTSSDIVEEMENRWESLERKKKKEFEEIEKLSKQKEKIQKEITDKFLKLKRNSSKEEDNENEKSKSTKRRKK